jgi:ERCC4-type nuclease
LALKVLQQNNLQQVANMTIEELSSIDGIGNKKAELIYNHFRGGS